MKARQLTLRLSLPAVIQRRLVFSDTVTADAVSVSSPNSVSRLRQLPKGEHRMKKQMLAVAAVTCFVSQMLAVGVADVEVSGGLDDVNATWALIKPAMITIGVAFLVWRLLKRGVSRS